jgi:hypothetical protein
MRTASPPTPAPDGALVRLLVHAGPWAEGIPPVPAGADVTVSFTDLDASLVHGEALGLLGYRLVGLGSADASAAPSADFLVPRALMDAHPTWWRALCEQADRAYDLAFGPVAARLAGVLRAHVPPGR